MAWKEAPRRTWPRDRLHLPPGVDGRQAQKWEPLIALADLAGAQWPTLARAACLAFVDGARDADAPDPKIRLLRDARDYFTSNADGYVTSDALIKWLTSDETRGWQEHYKEKPITPHVLAKLLRPFGLRPILRRAPELPDGRARAWSRVEFAPVWARYIPEKIEGAPSVDTVTSVTSVTSVTVGPFERARSVTDVTSAAKSTGSLWHMTFGLRPGPGQWLHDKLGMRAGRRVCSVAGPARRATFGRNAAAGFSMRRTEHSFWA